MSYNKRTVGITPPKIRMQPDKKSPSSANKNISISGDVKDSAVIIGDNNTVNQTFFQKVINIFKSDSETLEHRNRRILLGHVETAWIKGVLDASLHGAALLDLGIKQDPEAVTKYPWAIKKESTDETLPTGTSMLEIFDSIGMGRSLLILGAPGSGKTTMLLELARQLIERAREDVTYPIPMVFNLASWTEKLTLADWLAQELNNLYSIPRKTAPEWVQGNKLLLLLDGLDEVRQESRAKCVEAINAFRKEHGLTSLAVCSRSQDYADIKAKLAFEGAIEVQPLTQKQITEFFNRFGKEMAGIKQALEKDSALREMAETPLFLSIMIMAYRDKQDANIRTTKNPSEQQKDLIETYTTHMLNRLSINNSGFAKEDTLNRLSWLAANMINSNQTTFQIERISVKWLNRTSQILFYKGLSTLICGGVLGLMFLFLFNIVNETSSKFLIGIFLGMAAATILGAALGLLDENEVSQTAEKMVWSFKKLKSKIVLICVFGIIGFLRFGLKGALAVGGTGILISSLDAVVAETTNSPAQIIRYAIRNTLTASFIGTVLFTIIIWVIETDYFGLSQTLLISVLGGLGVGLYYGGIALIRYFSLLTTLSLYNNIPFHLIPFLDHCVDLIFLRRVGGGYIFVHRLLMEHFAEMYVETPTSKGNEK